MAIAQRSAEVVWNGTLEEGNGSFTVGSWMLGEVPITWASRTGAAEGSTSPEELIAAAHASCYAMALSVVLDVSGTPPEKLDVGATCTLDQAEEGFRITTVDLEVRGRVPGLSEKEFKEATERAHRICPVSNALKGNVEIRVTATVDED